MAKMNRTEISAKILKRKKFKVYIIRITLKLISTCAGKGLSFKPNMKQIHKAVKALRERHRIFTAILDFVKKAEKNQRKLQAISLRANRHTGNI